MASALFLGKKIAFPGKIRMITKNWASLLGRFSLVLVLTALELGIGSSQPVLAATLAVTNTNDSGAGSLRQVIADAGTGDVITFEPSLAGQTITLASDLLITSNGVDEKILTIDGSGLSPQVTISGGDVAHLEFSTQTNITISDLTIIHGYGGGIVSSGKLTVIDSTLKNNQAVGNGGGIYSSGTLTLKNSNITQNQADAGGGIYIGGISSHSILNSTITQNSASTGGGISVHGNAAVEVNNSTFAGNSAVQSAEIEMIGQVTELIATNSIFVCTPENSNCYSYSNVGHISLTNSITGVGTLSDYGLAALADNGGPTFTMALLPGSSLIDTGNDAACAAVDQRGVGRPKGNHCDIGAYEYEDLTPPTVLSIVRADPNPTSAGAVSFTVSFSENVLNVGSGDFSLATTGLTGAGITNVAGSGASYTVTVNTGSGNGTIRLDVVDDDSIVDLANHPLGGAGPGNGNFQGGETYDIIRISITGNAGVAGASLSYTDGSPKTATADGSGNYSLPVSYNWSGTVTPSRTGYTFSPVNRTYSNLTSGKTFEDYTATAITYTISGNAGTAGAVLNYTDGSPKTSTANGSGDYSFTVSYNWSGTVTPSRAGYTFSPVNKSYSNVTSNKTAQNYTATLIPPPSAEFDAWPTYINVPSTIKFHIVNTANMTGCNWDYGDGSVPGTTCDPYHDHTYTTPGFYTVSLTVTGPGGSDSKIRPKYITVYPTLMVNKTGAGTGTVTSSPAGINCGLSCSGSFNYQAVVTLTAHPSPGSIFIGWSGGGCSGTEPCTVTLETAVTVTGHFEIIVASCPSVTGWRGEYWVNPTLSGPPVLCRNDSSLDFDWGSGSPDPSVPADNFSAQWTRTVNLSSGTYLFHLDHDDGARLFVDDMVNPVLDKWGICCVVDASAPITLSGGNHVIRMEYFEAGGEANARLWWLKVSPAVTSITRADPDPASASSVHFNVTFSESVTNVDAHDFSLTTSGLTGASVTGVAGSGTARTVSVNTGMGNGTIRLDVVDDDSILNGSGFPLGGAGNGNGNYTSGEIYTVRKNPTFADVPNTHPYYQDIEILYANGLTGGCSTNPLKFCPDQTMNRGQAAVFILRGNFGSAFVPGPVTHIFKDDWTKGTWAEPWAEAMRNKGLSAGCLTSPLKYCPWDQIPREQAVIFALRLKYGTNYTPPPATGTLFADMTDPNYYATQWAEQAYKDGLIPSCGTSAGKPKICPKSAGEPGAGCLHDRPGQEFNNAMSQADSIK